MVVININGFFYFVRFTDDVAVTGVAKGTG